MTDEEQRSADIQDAWVRLQSLINPSDRFERRDDSFLGRDSNGPFSIRSTNHQQGQRGTATAKKGTPDATSYHRAARLRVGRGMRHDRRSCPDAAMPSRWEVRHGPQAPALPEFYGHASADAHASAGPDSNTHAHTHASAPAAAAGRTAAAAASASGRHSPRYQQ